MNGNWSRVVWTLLAVLTVSAGVFVGGYGLRRLDSRVEGLAVTIDRRTILNEKVCTENNQEACPALFDRLARNITRRQRIRLACDVSAVFLPDARIARLRREHRCPVPLGDGR
jgi:hypothetical protein